MSTISARAFILGSRPVSGVSAAVHAADIAALNDSIATKAPLASPALTGVPTVPTAAPGTNTTQIASTAFVTAGLALKAPLASPALTGTPTAPTAAIGTNSTQIATTEFVTTLGNRVFAASSILLTSVTGADTITASHYPAASGVTPAQSGQIYVMRNVGTNTTSAVTLAVGGGAALPVYDAHGASLSAGDLKAGDYIILACVSGTSYRVISSLMTPAQVRAEVAAKREKTLMHVGTVPTVERDAEIVVDPVNHRVIRRTDRLGRQIDGRGLALVAEPDVEIAVRRIAQMRIGTVLTVERDAEIVVDPVNRRVIRRTDRLGRQYGEYRTLSGSPILSADNVDEYVSAAASFGHGLDSLWRTAEKRRGIELGQNQQLVISIIGDSWTGPRGYWIEAMTLHLRDILGDAGPGWVGFAASPSGYIVEGATADITVARTGTWTDYYGTGNSPDAGQVVSSTAGARYTLTGPAGLSDLKLFGSSGTIRYSWDAGVTWTTLALVGDALQVHDLAGLPASAWTLWIEVVSGTVKLSGVNALKAGPGVRVNKLGKNGTHTAQWASINEVDFSVGHAALGSDLVIVHHGTNDQWLSGAVTSTPNEYHDYVDTIVSRLRAAVPTADILLSTPPSVRAEGYPMSDYAAAMRRIAIARQVAHVDLQFRFGRDLDEYKFGADRELLDSTLIHPTGTGGRAVLVDTFANVINRS